MHPNGGFEEEEALGISLASLRSMLSSTTTTAATPSSSLSAASSEQGDPAAASTAALLEEEEQARIRDDLGRLLEVWATLSEDTKAFLQMQAAIPSAAAVSKKAAAVSVTVAAAAAVPATATTKGAAPPLSLITAALAAQKTKLSGAASSSTASLATLVPPASPVGGCSPSSAASSASTSPQRAHTLLLPRAPSPALSSLSVSSSSSSGEGSSSSGGSSGVQHRLEPVARAPDNVFVLRDDEGRHCGWRNTFHLPVSYDVEMLPDLLSLGNEALAVKHVPADLRRRRFVVLDAAVHALYGAQLARYYAHHGVAAHLMVLPGEEANKRQEAVTEILEQLTQFGLRRREPVVAIGGGVILDIVGMAANLYRRGVPYIRVPTTLLAIVDASVGVKNGVDFDSRACGCQKNRVGSFYAPSAALLDKSFIRTQDDRNIINGLGEIMKLALVRSPELFGLLEAHGPRLVAEKFQGADGVADRVIELSIQIMLEELGPNLWEHTLERCVDFGHTFSKIIEMLPGVDIMHGEAVNVDGFFCVLLSRRRGLISAAERDRILGAMRGIGLPTMVPRCSVGMLYKGLEDAVEHRHGAQRIPLLTGIGAAHCVNDITRAELAGAVRELFEVHGLPLPADAMDGAEDEEESEVTASSS